ncbi:hypothetical protein MNBD_GAMMA22-1162 [hydrothermal vent metagenome]|uniref:Thioredoxin domain-containing protein n=1 Tax=hydrothermal vent metagenome TaxID=652676 RepID=A0A3B1AER4_9ZZZZ
MVLKVGDKAPDFEMTDFKNEKQVLLGHGKPILLTFFRHAGCPMCNLRMRELILVNDKMANYNLKILTIFESPTKSIKRDVGRQNPPFSIIPDPERKLYKLFGVTISWVGFVKIFAVRPKHVFEAIFKNGFIPKFGEATPMMPADFLIDNDGIIRVAYYGRDIGDHLSFDDLYAALDGIKTSVDITPEIA